MVKTLKYLGENGFKRNKTRWMSAHRRRHVIKVPRVFSIIKNPEETLETLDEIVTAAKDPSIVELFFDHGDCSVMGLGASTIVDILVLAAQSAWRQTNRRVRLSGQYPSDPTVQEIFKIAGLIKHIRHPDSVLPPYVAKRYKIFELQFGEKSPKTSARKSTRAEVVISELTEYFSDLLEEKGYSLTGRGKNNLSMLVGEVIDNAEQHSDQKEWFVIGYMSQITKDLSNCNVVILDFGRTIADTLEGAHGSMPIRTVEHMDELIKKHTSRGFFQIGGKWTKENFNTLFALQEGKTQQIKQGRQTERSRAMARLA